MRSHESEAFLPLGGGVPPLSSILVGPYPCIFAPACPFVAADGDTLSLHMCSVHLPTSEEGRPNPIVEATSAGGRRNRRIPTDESHPCPMGCQAVFYSVDAVIHHVQSIHIMREDVSPDDVWLRSVKRR